MNLRNKNLKSAFVAMLFFCLFSQIISPSLRLLFFAPFIIITYYQKSYVAALNYSLLVGLILDLFTSPLRFGLNALNYTMTTAFIYNQKKNFFADSPTTLPLMTFIFSILSTLIQITLLSIFSKPISLSLTWIFSDLIIMPALDALFAFAWFILPHFLFRKRIVH
jgi:rod shape-determining protein MreD